MTRSTIGNLIASFNGGSKIAELHCGIVKKNNQFRVTVKASTCSGMVDICGDNGQVKKFTAVDDVITGLAKARSLAPSVSISFDNSAVLDPAEFKGDIVAKNEGIVTAYMKRSETAGTTSATLAQELALMAGDVSVSPDTITEKTAQKTAVDALKVWLDAEIFRINLILNPPAMQA